MTEKVNLGVVVQWCLANLDKFGFDKSDLRLGDDSQMPVKVVLLIWHSDFLASLTVWSGGTTECIVMDETKANIILNKDETFNDEHELLRIILDRVNEVRNLMGVR